jgi:hypothetical protein
MRIHGPDAQEQLLGDLGIGPASRKQTQDHDLAIAQAFRVGAARRLLRSRRALQRLQRRPGAALIPCRREPWFSQGLRYVRRPT